jgi:hypothetical protein
MLRVYSAAAAPLESVHKPLSTLTGTDTAETLSAKVVNPVRAVLLH